MAQPPCSPQPGAPSVTPVFPVHCVHSHVVLIGVGMPMRRIDAQADRVQELAATMSKKLLFRGQPHEAELASAGLWCLLCLFRDCFTCGGCWVVVWCGLKLATIYTGFGASQEMKAKVS